MSSTAVESARPAPRLTRITSGVFLAVIGLIPLVQMIGEIRSGSTGGPTALRLFPAAARVLTTAGNSQNSLYEQALTINEQLCAELRQYERQVTESAWPLDRPRAWLQANLTGPLSSGNEQVVVGPQGWLFFRPDVDALTGPGFLEPHSFRPGVLPASRQTNPLPAIQRFAADLQARGIELLVVPIPSKGALLGLNQRGAGPVSPIHNASFPQFLAELERSQIPICDPTPVLFAGGEKPLVSPPRYLKTDSHWTPAGVQQTAQLIAAQLRASGRFARTSNPRYATTVVPIENVGDTARLLGGVAASPVVTPEHCAISQVRNRDHSPWQSDPQAEILLLGDSFTNIYSQAELGWGVSAGFAEQLSEALNRPIDRISLNAGGALAARRELLRQLQQPGTDRLAGKKIVIWQFAERELTLGDWQVLPLPAPSTATSSKPTSATPIPSSETTVEGLIVQAGHLPNPASLPYREALIPLHLQSVKSLGAGKSPTEIVVYVWGLQERRLTPMADWKSGQQVRLKLVPWSHAETEFGQFARAELEDPDFQLIDLPTYWGVPVK